MFDGVYNYFFGQEESQLDSAQAQPRRSEEDWIMVDDAKSGRSSPVLLADPEVTELDDLMSEASSALRQPVVSAAELQKSAEVQELVRKEELKRRELARFEQRLWLEEKLFEEPDTPSSGSDASPPASVHNSPPPPPKALQKLCKPAPPASRKPKQRSKKAGRAGSGRSNDRKCNNIK